MMSTAAIIFFLFFFRSCRQCQQKTGADNCSESGQDESMCAVSKYEQLWVFRFGRIRAARSFTWLEGFTSSNLGWKPNSSPIQPRSTPITSPISSATPNNCSYYSPITARLPVRHRNCSEIPCQTAASAVPIIPIFSYFCLSSLGVCGWRWLFSYDPVLFVADSGVRPVFLPSSCYRLSHVVHEPCLQAIQ